MIRESGEGKATEQIVIGGRRIGDGSPKVFVIAELSANHNQKFELAVETIKAAAAAGADAVKLQTYTPDTITIDTDRPDFQVTQGTIWDGTTLHQLYQTAFTPWEWQPKLKKIAEKKGLACFSSAFDRSAVDFLEKMDVPAHKVASFEITDIPLIEHMAKKGKPMIISTGVARKEDIALAVKTCRRVGNNQIALLKCTSAYPTPLEDVNLLTIPDLARRFSAVVGLSDHTMTLASPVASVALGGRIIEKHLILDRKLGGPDSKFSLEPAEFKAMVQAVRDTERLLGKISYELTEKMARSREHSRSLYVVRDIKKGERFSLDSVRSIRPGFGLHPKYLKQVLGKKAARAIERGERMSLNLVSE